MRLLHANFPVIVTVLSVIAAAGTGAAPSIVTSMPGASHDKPLPPATAAQRDLAQRLRQHVHALGNTQRNAAHCEQLVDAADYIEARLSEMGFAVRRQDVPNPACPAPNLEVVLNPDESTLASSSAARAEARPLVIAGAHYDSAAGSPGANDNATGVAAVIELARILKDRPLPASSQIRLLLYANEEAPHFGTDRMGSLVHARSLRAQGARVKAMLSLETLGYYSDETGSQHYPPPLERHYPAAGNFVGFVGDLDSRSLVEQAIGVFRRHAEFPSEGLAAPPSLPAIYRSDHWAYRAFGYPAIMITDTAPYRYPHYHRPSDLPEKVDFGRLARVVEGIAPVIMDLAAR